MPDHPRHATRATCTAIRSAPTATTPQELIDNAGPGRAVCRGHHRSRRDRRRSSCSWPTADRRERRLCGPTPACGSCWIRVLVRHPRRRRRTYGYGLIGSIPSWRPRWRPPKSEQERGLRGIVPPAHGPRACRWTGELMFCFNLAVLTAGPRRGPRPGRSPAQAYLRGDGRPGAIPSTWSEAKLLVRDDPRLNVPRRKIDPWRGDCVDPPLPRNRRAGASST